jgi:hypothetical protein
MNFTEQEDSVILLIDGNSTMKQSDLKSALEKCYLRQVLLKKHGMYGPSTFRKTIIKFLLMEYGPPKA